MNTSFRTLTVALLLTLGMSQAIATAQFVSQFDPTTARSSVESGKKIKLATILRKLKDTYGGYHTKAELFSTPIGGLEYRIDWVAGDGRVLFIRVDAEDGEITSVEGGS